MWSDFKTPQTPVPEAWKVSSAQNAEAKWPDADWWKNFQSDALTAQIEEAHKNNFDLAAAVARVKQADAQARIAGAPLFPFIGADGSAVRARSSGSSRSASAIGVMSRPRINNAYSGTLNASYELDFWGKNYAAAESAQALADASRFDQQTVVLSVNSSVASNYFEILATKERLAVARDNLANAEKVLETVRARFDAGVATGLDVAQQENVVETQRATVPPLELRLQQALNAQAILLGKLPESMMLPEATLADIRVPEVEAGLPSQLLQRRPDVLSAEAQLASADADIIAARAAFFPSIQLTGAGGYESTALSQLFQPDSMIFSIGAGLTQPIFRGGLLMGQLDFNKARQEELVQNYRKSVVSAFSDVEDALAAVQQGAAQTQAQQAAQATAQKAFELSKQQMDEGLVDITTMLDTQRNLFAAQDALLQARLTQLQAIVSLYRALGGGWSNAETPAFQEQPQPTPEPAPPSGADSLGTLI